MSELRQKYTFRFGGKKIIFIKKPSESEAHVFGKAVLFALYRDEYPDLTVEIPVEGKYKPDLVSFDEEGRLRFWAESGTVSRRKVADLLHKYPATHLVFLRHTFNLDTFADLVKKACTSLPRRRTAPVEIIGRPADLTPFIDKKSELRIRRSDCRIVVL